MKLRYMVPVLALGVFSSVFAGTAADDISVLDPYVRAMPPGQPTSAGFLGLQNNSDQDHALVAAEGDFARVLELHTHTMIDGMMHMDQLEEINVLAGKVVMLQPGGLHLMIMGLKKDLMPGETVSITLVFEDGSKKHLDLPVRKVQIKMDKMNGEESMDHTKYMDH